MVGQFEHDMLPKATHDEGARLDFIFDLKVHLLRTIGPGNKAIYRDVAKPYFEKMNGRAPANKNEVGSVMRDQPYWQAYSSLTRAAQEMMWDTCGETVERQLPHLIGKARTSRMSNRKKGSLRLNPDMEIPRYISGLDTHCQPGGYCSDLADDDVGAGALYDSAVYTYLLGSAGPMNSAFGDSAIEFLKREHPELNPRRILDMGCSVGHSTLPYVEAYPDAEVHAIDVGAPMLRYAHARAEGLEKCVEFAQQDAERTDYPDGWFDLVVSHIFFHETSAKALPAILEECHRLLSPGGVMVHCELPIFHKDVPDPYDHFARDWPGPYNAEPFWSSLHELDLTKSATDAGFAKDKIAEIIEDSSTDEGLHENAMYLLVGRR